MRAKTRTAEGAVEALERAGDGAARDAGDERDKRGACETGVEVAHELKNPLSAVKALVQLGLRNPAERASHERLAVVEREVTRMEEIVRACLSSRRPLEQVEPERVCLASLVSEALGALSGRAAGAGVHLASWGDAEVLGDPRRLREAVLNLVSNAIEATPPGGAVVVEVRPGRDEAAGGREVELVVHDTGRGMPEETLRRVGTPFFTTRAEGNGLGVALARSALSLHGGYLRYESEPGKGTTARATLPAGRLRARVARARTG
jgi:signal transduction histidine kinase